MIFSLILCMTLGTEQRLDGSHISDIKAGDVSIEYVSNQKLLGIYIDENLCWTIHIEYLCKTVSSRISLLRQLSEYVPTHVQIQFYQTFILPLLHYCSVTWGSTSTANIERLAKLQKRASRIILRCDFDKPLGTMFQELGWMSIESKIK